MSPVGRGTAKQGRADMDIAKYWKTIFDTLREGLIVVDPGGRILDINASAERITGYSVDEIRGKSCRVLNCTGCDIYGDAGPGKWCGLFEKEVIEDKRCTIKDRKNRAVHILKSASVLKDPEGRIIGAVETITDIGEAVRQEREIASLRRRFRVDEGFHGIVGNAPVMQQLFELIENVGATGAPVLITGPSGTGKELVARAIHDSGPRKGMPFIKVNCAALNENLLESELFGHVRGAFTGAERNRVGRFEAAHGGTIFLDEIGDIPVSIQVKLLRVLEEKEIERVGDNQPVPVDVRVISATNRDMERLIEEGAFREDFYFRINVFPLECPRLGERAEDIPLIVESLVKGKKAGSPRKIKGVTPEAMERLISYAWPGNVRELRNAVDYAFVLCPGGLIGTEHLPAKITAGCVPPKPSNGAREELVKALEEAGGNRSEAARILGVSRVTVWKRMKKYNVA